MIPNQKKSGNRWHTVLSVFLVAGLTVSPNAVWAIDVNTLPGGGTVTSGTATIDSTDATMVVSQSTDKLITQWDSFNIGQDASVQFVQPGSGSIALNRISDQNPTQILGQLQANGQVFLLNPAGIIFGAASQINVAGLIASTLNLSDEDFLNGTYRFSGGSSGSITNLGQISAKGGVVALIGAQVRNEGTINVKQGTGALIAGQEVTLDFAGDGLINYSVEQGAVDALAQNNGLIEADGGMVVMTARAADSLTGAVVRNDGEIKAPTLENRAGRIILDAEEGMTAVAGTLDVSSSDGSGGSIVATGKQVWIQEGAHLNASGTTGGGSVLVGGSWQNSDPGVRQATATVIDQGTLLEANATDTGNGGTIVAWSDIGDSLSITSVYGALQAKGGPNGGDGGRIETSGYCLDIGTSPDTGATLGQAGVWLIDPYNISVVAGGANTNINAGNPFESYGDTSSLGVDLIDTALDTGDVIVRTGDGGAQAGNITWDTVYTYTGGNARSLSLEADGSIIINQAISSTTEALTLNLTATGGSVTSASDIGLNGGDLVVDAATASTLSGIISGSGGLQTSGAGTLSISNASNTFTGQTTIDSGSTLAITDNFGQSLKTSSHIANSGTLTFLNSNNVGTLESIAGSGNVLLNSSSITIENNSGEVSGSISGSGGITLNGGSLTLSGSNSFTGLINLSNATLTAGHSNALGTSANGISISQGATLALENDITIADAISVAGTGVGAGGAIISRGTNTLSGAITLVGADVSMVSDSGTLNFTNTIDGAYGLTITGAGEVSFQGEVGGSTPVLFLDANAGTTTYISADITTLGEQIYRNKVSALVSAVLSAVGAAGATIESIAAGLPISAYSYTSGSCPDTETVDKAFDGNAGTKYLNRDGAGSDVLIEGSDPYIVTGLKLTTANDATNRDPTSYTLYGSNTSISADMVLISSGALSAPTNRYTDYPEVTFSNETAYIYYRLVFNTIRDPSSENLMQIARIYLPGKIPTSGDINPNITFSDTVTASSNLTVDAVDNININSTVNTGGNLSLTSGGAITQSAAFTVAGTTTLDSGSSNITLTHAGNSFGGAVSVDGGQNATITHTNAMTLGAVDVSGLVDIATLSGNLTLTGAVSTTNTTADAIILNAAKDTAAGTSTGGDIIVSGGSVTVGAGGTAKLYSGSVSGSTGLTALIGSGSGNFRYNSDESATNYTTALSTGKNAIYREQPTITIDADDETVTYGTAPSLATTKSGLQNGDTSGQAIGTPASVAVSGTTSTSGNYTAATSHTLTPSGAVGGLGYAINYTTGSLTVNKKGITTSGITADNKVYDGLTTATVDVSGATLTGLVSGDAVSVSATGTFDNKNVGAGKTVTLASTNSGADVGNYTITDQAGTTADITKKAITVTANSSNVTYNGLNYSINGFTASGLVNGETTSELDGVSTAGGSGTNAGSYAHTASGTDENYSLTFVAGSLNIAKADATVTANSSNVTYDGLSHSVTGFTASGLVNGETTAVLDGVSTAGGTGTNAGSYAHTASGTDENYSLTFVDGSLIISKADLMITALDDSKEYDSNAYSGGNGVTYSGFVTGEDSSVLGGTLSYGGTAQGAVNAGNYTITPQGLTAANYNMNFLNGSLTITGGESEDTPPAASPPPASSPPPESPGIVEIVGSSLSAPPRVNGTQNPLSGSSSPQQNVPDLGAGNGPGLFNNNAGGELIIDRTGYRNEDEVI